MNTDELIDRLVANRGSERAALAWLIGRHDAVVHELAKVYVAIGSTPRSRTVQEMFDNEGY